VIDAFEFRKAEGRDLRPSSASFRSATLKTSRSMSQGTAKSGTILLVRAAMNRAGAEGRFEIRDWRGAVHPPSGRASTGLYRGCLAQSLEGSKNRKRCPGLNR
jgi:hypothetical protein